EAKQLKIILTRSRQETHISQQATESGEGADEETESDGESEEEETREEAEESFDPIPRTLEDIEDDGNGEEDQGLRISEEEMMHEEEEADELYRDVDINQGRGLQVSQDIEDFHVTLTPVHFDGQQESSSTSSFVTSLLNSIIDPDRVKLLEVNFSEFMRTNQSPEAVSNIPGIVHQYMHQEMTEAVQEAVQIQTDWLQDSEGPSAGSDRESKRRRKGEEHASASTPSEPATRSAGKSTTGTQSRQMFASESAFAEEPVQTTCQMEEPSHLVFETAVQGNAQSWISKLAKQTDARSSFNELLDTPIDFSNFIMNRLVVDTLTPELMAGPTYELMRGSCNSLTELEYHFEEVYKATTDQLDWVNPEGQQYPHNLLQPLPLIPDNQGLRVIPFEHFINNDLEYLWGGASSRKYTTSVTKTKAADYGHIKWIEDLVPRTMWIHEPLNYDKHAFWGVSHWGQKCQQFYGFAVNQESTLDVYSKRRIITVTNLKIVEWHNYKYLDWISVLRDDDKIYKFKEGDFKRLRLQDIEDMLLLLVQGKLSNLTVEERFAFNVSLRIFTRSIVIQHDGTLNDVRNALDYRLKGIRMQYLPTTIWRKGDKDRAAAIIQAIDKMLKTSRIMRSLERFVGGRQYEGDFRMLQRTI
nr:hypothetical protein [Tanacetum cinerariifolium]